jgi:drug/metabolite transporter (DMT)-like permease
MDQVEVLEPEAGRVEHSAGLAVAALVVCCVFWGYSFPVMQFGTAAFDRHVLPTGAGGAEVLASRGLFNGVRFGLAAMLYGVLTWPRQRKFGRDDVIGGTLVGTFFAAGMMFQVVGLRWVLPSVSGFFTALPVVFAPLAQALILKRAVGGKTWLAVVLAVVGIVLLSWPKPDAVAANTVAIRPPVPYLGELLTIAGAAVFTAEIICVHHFGQTADAVRLTFVMLVTTAVLSVILGAVMGPGLLRVSAWRGLLSDREVAWTMATLVVVSSVMALHMMNIYQPRVSPAIASVVYCTEPLFSTLFSVLFATERLTMMTIAGGAVVIGSVLMVAKGRRKENEPQIDTDAHR